jgi:hypothetical protein
MPKRALNSVEKSAEKSAKPIRNLASEKKIVPFPSLSHRQSISERKPIPGIDAAFSRVPRPTGARKGLDFGEKQPEPKTVGKLAIAHLN